MLYPGRVSSEPNGPDDNCNEFILEKLKRVLVNGSVKPESFISLHVSVQVSILANDVVIPAEYTTSPELTYVTAGFKNLSFQSAGYPCPAPLPVS